jgi:septal ring factor EnvC (AmiA/AmiB activator)
MKLLRRFTGLTLAGLFAMGLLASCASHPTEEQIKVMEESKAAALSAEQEYQSKQTERKDLEKKVEAKKQELSDAQRELEAVKKRVEEMKNKTE